MLKYLYKNIDQEVYVKEGLMTYVDGRRVESVPAIVLVNQLGQEGWKVKHVHNSQGPGRDGIYYLLEKVEEDGS